MQIALHKLKSHRTDATCSAAPRKGATLTEVLMSLLIFSVGIVSIFTLFPISLLSSIQATKLTNSKILVDNVTELVRARPSLLLGGQPWLPNTSYVDQSWVFPTPSSGELRPRHLRGFRANGAANSQNVEPFWDLTNNVEERDSSGNLTATWQPRAPGWAVVDPSVTPLVPKTYVVDPLGALSATTSNEFGTNIFSLANGSALPRRDGDDLGFGSTQAVVDYFVLQDSWSVNLEVVPASISGSGTDITLPNNVNVDGINLDPRLTRVVFSNLERTNSAVRSLNTGTGGNTLVVQPAIGGSFTGPLRIESFNSRYSWLATVNRDSTGRVLAECVIFFNRSFNETDEQLYEYSIDSIDSITVDWGQPSQRPLLIEGKFCFDTRSGRWHEIVNINEGTNVATITVNPSLQGSFSAGDLGDMIFMPGIVTVFNIEL